MKTNPGKLICCLLPFFIAALAAEARESTWETMKYGLFVHYVFGGEYSGMTPLGKGGGYPRTIDSCAEKFDVRKFADDVKAMGFEYVIFTVWHANMGVLYPSKVMADYKFDQHDHFTAKRDLPGEIMDSLAVRGIKFAVYSHIWDGHDFHPSGGGYFSYDNKSGKKTQDMINTGYVESVNGNSTKWNEFICKVYDEMSTRYGEKVSAYWFDATWTNAVDKKQIMNTIRKTNTKCAFVANGTPDHGLPYSSKEVGSPAASDYGFNKEYPPVKNEDVTTWPSYIRNIALIQGGNWWASQSGKPKFSAETIYRFTVFESGTNTGGGVSWAFSPFVDGTWEGDMLAVMKKAYSYLEPVAEAVKNTRASASYVTKEGSKMSTLGKAYVATTSADGLYEYIHVLNRPKDDFFTLPKTADGRAFDSAVLPAKKKNVPFEKNNQGYRITLPPGEQWDSLNTVFRLHLSEFMVIGTGQTYTTTHPWKAQNVTVKDESGQTVAFTMTGDTVSFASKSKQKYFISATGVSGIAAGVYGRHPSPRFMTIRKKNIDCSVILERASIVDIFDVRGRVIRSSSSFPFSLHPLAPGAYCAALRRNRTTIETVKFTIH